VAGETEVLGENLPQRHVTSTQDQFDETYHFFSMSMAKIVKKASSIRTSTTEDGNFDVGW
jgi:hypothetical protein